MVGAGERRGWYRTAGKGGQKQKHKKLHQDQERGEQLTWEYLHIS